MKAARKRKQPRRAVRKTTRRPSATRPKPRMARPSRRSSLAAPARRPAPAKRHGPHLIVLPKRRAKPIPSPMPTRHVALPRPTLAMPARSMPPGRDSRKLSAALNRAPMPLPDFSEAGVILAITYSIREGRRNEFFELLRELKPLLAGIGGTDSTVYEDRSRPNYFMEVFRFKDEAEFTAFDDKFHKDRRIAAVYALLDDIVEAEKSDFKIFERRL